MTRHLAIGDIHGCINALRALIDYVEPRSGDTVVTLGDYVDRGPDSSAVLEFIMALGSTCDVVPLRGNHEIMMLDSRDNKSWRHAWLQYGGDATLRSYATSEDDAGSFDDVPDAHFDFLENRLLPFYECETHFFVHANADAKRKLEDQSEAALYWQKYKDPPPHFSGKIMVCGHTPQSTGMPGTNGHSICIDTGACRGDWLSCLDVESETVWQANEAGETRRFSLDEIEKTAG